MSGNMIDLDALTVEKQYIISAMSNEEVRQMLMQVLAPHYKSSVASTPEKQDNAPLVELDEIVKAKLTKHRNLQARLDDRASRWLDMTEKVLTLGYQFPKYTGMDMHDVYRDLRKELNRHFLPEDFIENLVPPLMAYIVNGEMPRAALVVGPAGCGKTTALEIVATVLGMAFYRFDALTAFTSHGLYGEGASFSGPDIGDITKGKVETGFLNPFYIVDEVEKSPPPGNRTSFQDELLPICDKSQDSYMDNFLGFRLPLNHSVFMFTANSLDGLSEPLLDRVEVIRFPEVKVDRMKRIITSYATDMQRKNLYSGCITIDIPALNHAVERLYDLGTHSIRQHQNLVEYAFRTAFTIFLTGRETVVTIDDEVYRNAFTLYEAKKNSSRIGFFR